MPKKRKEKAGEKCDRCGSVGEDRRTLWMACFYAMHELNIPFTEISIHGVACKKTGSKKLELFNLDVPVFADPVGKAEHRGFYTLRVCRRCRAGWMAAIESWFNRCPGGIDCDADEPEDEGDQFRNLRARERNDKGNQPGRVGPEKSMPRAGDIFKGEIQCLAPVQRRRQRRK